MVMNYHTKPGQGWKIIKDNKAIPDKYNVFDKYLFDKQDKNGI
jgi:hypothetical protein